MVDTLLTQHFRDERAKRKSVSLKDTELVLGAIKGLNLGVITRAYVHNHATFLPAGLVKMEKIDGISVPKVVKTLAHTLKKYQLVQTFGGQFGRCHQSCQFASLLDHSWKFMTYKENTFTSVQ